MSKQQFMAENLQEGEIYAGLILGKDGAADYHLFLQPGRTSAVTHDQPADVAPVLQALGRVQDGGQLGRREASGRVALQLALQVGQAGGLWLCQVGRFDVLAVRAEDAGSCHGGAYQVARGSTRRR